MMLSEEESFCLLTSLFSLEEDTADPVKEFSAVKTQKMEERHKCLILDHKLHIQNLSGLVSKVCQLLSLGMLNSVIIGTVFSIGNTSDIISSAVAGRSLKRSTFPRRRSVFKKLYFQLGHSHCVTSIKPPPWD